MKNKIDLVYILGLGSCWSDNEIRYSIRSAVKNFEFNRLVVIGEKPSWMTNVVHIPLEDKFTNKLANARKKYIAAAKSKSISEDFILMNDDFFFLKKVEEIKNYSRGSLMASIQRHNTKSGYYFRALCDTRAMLSTLGIYEPMDFEVHSPIVLNKKDLINVISVVGNHKPFLLRSAYGNLMELDCEEIKDVKVGSLKELEELKERDVEFLSITNGMVVTREFRDWLQSEFPDASKYENDDGMGATDEPGQSMRSKKYYARHTFMYGGIQFLKGQIIERDIISKIKENSKMNDLWELK